MTPEDHVGAKREGLCLKMKNCFVNRTIRDVRSIKCL